MSYGQRIGFVDPKNKTLLKTNPRREYGKLGIACRSYVESFFDSTIQVEVREIKTLNKRVTYLDKKDTVEWLNSQLGEHKKLVYPHLTKKLYQKSTN